MTRSGWDFDYAPLHVYSEFGSESAFVVALADDADAATLVRALAEIAESASATALLRVYPLFWWRIDLSEELDASVVSAKLEACGVSVRYVASARYGSQALGKPADFAGSSSCQSRSWKVQSQRRSGDEATPGRWFLDEHGVNVCREVCGTGAGTRLAVIDNEAGGIEYLELDSEVRVGVSSPPRATLHAALMVGWAVGAERGLDAHPGSKRFCGVAPDASTRLYCVPKPGQEVYNLPLAIVRAVDDGADVVVCSTYVDGQTSPMLDDALEFARRLGRGGKGTAIVMPASREMSSVEGSRHASLSLGPSEPAADPRVFCVGPSSHDGQWFLWRDKRGRMHPFANRGPSLRWLAPGDDMAMPLSGKERIVHAESSGAASIAAGVLLLVFGTNPELSVDEVDLLLTKTADPVDPAAQHRQIDLADPEDLLPLAVDRDGHNAKHGYGRIDAMRACAAARDPLAAFFLRVGEDALGTALAAASIRGEGTVIGQALARWMTRELIRDEALWQAFAAIARSIRLWIAHPDRFSQQPTGMLTRQLLISIRSYLLAPGRDVPPEIERELRALELRLGAAGEDAGPSEQRWLSWLADLKRAPEARGGPCLARVG